MSCLGNEIETLCVYYTGPNIPSLGIVSGEKLESVIAKLATLSSPGVVEQTTITSDEIVSKSLSRNTSSICSSKIVKRDFPFSTTKDGNNIILSWDLLEVLSKLPSGYAQATVRVKITGEGSPNLIADSRAAKGTLPLALSKLPITVDFLIRIVSPCGDIDLETSKQVIFSADQAIRLTLDANDLNPQNGQISLTDQLNALEAKVATLGVMVESATQVEISGSSKEVSPVVSQHETRLTELESVNPNELEIDYVDSLGKTGTISETITNLYSQISSLKNQNDQLKAQLNSLQTQVTSLTAIT